LNDEKLPIASINSGAKFVLFDQYAGVVSEHEKVGEALRQLALEISANLLTEATVFERTAEQWVRVL
jgi:hypothetical protein